MKSFAAFALLLAPAAAFPAGLVSAFDFSNTLNPFVDNNPGRVLPLVSLSGGANPTGLTPTFATATVGAVTKPVLSFSALGTLHAFHGVGANGGGSYVNQYTILMDVRFDTQPSGAYASLFNTNATNSNDGDSFLKWGAGGVAGVGISGSYVGSVTGDAWHRLAVAVDQTAGVITYYVDGAQANQVSVGAATDGRWAMYTYNDGDTDDDGVYVFGDNDGDNGSGQLSQLAFFDHALTLNEIGQLGPVGQPVPEPATLAVLGLGALAALRRRRN